MKNFLLFFLFVTSVLSFAVKGQGGTPAPIVPENLHWVSPSNITGLQVAWVLGAEQKPGAYILRVKIPRGMAIPPHTHPDERNTTVLKGTVYVGFGETFDETKVVAIPPGAVYVAPANVPHYIWARDGDVLYQEAGMGPTGTELIKR